MSDILATLQAAEPTGWWGHFLEFLDTPAPYSPFSEYLLVLFLLWLLARRDQARRNRKALETQAQDVLDAKYAAGELSEDAYNKYRQEVSLRLRR